ncbi:MAG: hypothetical protein JW807_03640 [Spirochaetes bacterium]|nr:hypothetical protein [Spirochaetota bacterium]
MRGEALGRQTALILAVIVAGSCYSYRGVTTERRMRIEAVASPGASLARVKVERTLARMNRPGPLSSINNRAVELAEAGRTGEAEILFREVVAEGAGEPAGYNNLAVLCELAGRRDEAFRMYAEACRLDPGNPRFRNNFRTFADFREEGRGRP